MMNKYVRLLIAGILLPVSIVLFVKGLVSVGVVLVLISLLFVLLHFKNEKNLLAFYFVRKNKFEKAGKVLNRVKNPERMIKSQEAYFYYLSGLMESQQHNNSKAEKLFKKALKTGLRTDTDQAVSKLNLSGIYLSQRNKKLSKYYLQEAKKQDKRKMLTAQVREIENMMKRV
ncbi:tetratricopeptide repeat protein [Marinifilum sp. RC60d5]|uniref:tetratricopeptide repeat protein n=1 Tax=Marinifilum sp. RC60d5 TaxID=3458414 RepID=UPI0040369B4C